MKTRMIYLFVCAFSICACSKSYDTIVQGDDISEAQVITKGGKGHEILGDYLVTKEDADFYIQVFMPDKVVKDVKEIQGNHASSTRYYYR